MKRKTTRKNKTRMTRDQQLALLVRPRDIKIKPSSQFKKTKKA